jgi:VWFA-related protein
LGASRTVIFRDVRAILFRSDLQTKGDRMRGRRLAAIGLSVALGSILSARQQTQETRQTPTFRTGVTVVPIDVRVVDRSGKPVTDLKQSDFTIVEDGIPQRIVHFFFQTLAPSTDPPGDRPLDLRKPLGETVAPQNKRIFLIVLGRGRQVGPVKGVEAAIRFVKERLLPQDQVAIMAYNRSTDFTTDHKQVVETLDRYWKKHEGIDARLRLHFSGLAAIYSDGQIPVAIQKDIDAVFRAPGALTSRTVIDTAVTDSARVADDNRRNRDLIQRAEIAADRQQAGLATAFDQTAIDEAEAAGMSGMSFDEYVEKSFDTNSDLGNLYAGVRYLRWLDGEKHLVFITPKGLFLPRLENTNSIAALANDARVTVDVIHTYGVEAPPMMMGAMGASSRGPGRLPPMRTGFVQAFQNSDSRRIAQLTGGQMSAYRSGESFFSRLDDSTRAQYLIGYSPANTNWNGKYRRLEVKVNRKDVQVLYRHGYLARTDTMRLDRREYLAYSRIASAANVARNIDDLGMAIGEAKVETEGSGRVLSVRIDIRPGAIKVTPAGGMYTGKLEAVSICVDRRQMMVGEVWHTIDIKMTEPNYQRLMREGVSYTARVPLRGDPRYVKAIIYDHTADLIGSVMMELGGKQ